MSGARWVIFWMGFGGDIFWLGGDLFWLAGDEWGSVGNFLWLGGVQWGSVGFSGGRWG